MWTPANIYKGVRDAVVIAIILFVGWRIYTDGKNAVKAGDLKALQQQVVELNLIVAKWNREATAANEQFAKEIHDINAAPVVVHDWVRPQPSCAKEVLPTPTGAPGSRTTAGGGNQPVSGPAADGPRRDVIVADWKRFWEARVAGCRLEHAQWPTP